MAGIATSGGRSDPAVEARVAEPDDAAEVAEVFLAAARAGWGSFLDRNLLDALPAQVEAWRERITDVDTGVFLVADLGGDVVGFASTRADEVATLYTDPSVRGLGVGRLLLDAAVAALRTAGTTRAVLWTEERNVDPRRFYERGGWVADGATRDRTFMGQPIHEVRYGIDLT